MEFDTGAAFILGALVMFGLFQFKKVLNYDPFPEPPMRVTPVRRWEWQPPCPPQGVEPLDRFKKGKP